MSAHSACLRVGFLQYTFLRPSRAFLLHFGARQHSARSKRAAQGQGQLQKPLPRCHQLRPDNMSLPCGLPVRSTQVAEPPPVGASSRSSATSFKKSRHSQGQRLCSNSSLGGHKLRFDNKSLPCDLSTDRRSPGQPPAGCNACAARQQASRNHFIILQVQARTPQQQQAPNRQ